MLMAEGRMIPDGPLNRRKHRIDDRASMASPLGAAISRADSETIGMVRSALETGRLRLAYQPVVLGSDPQKIAFHEGLIRVLEPSGRIIPARDFITVGLFVDTADQQASAMPACQQSESIGKPLCASGQDDDAIGLTNAVRLECRD